MRRAVQENRTVIPEQERFVTLETYEGRHGKVRWVRPRLNPDLAPFQTILEMIQNRSLHFDLPVCSSDLNNARKVPTRHNLIFGCFCESSTLRHACKLDVIGPKVHCSISRDLGVVTENSFFKRTKAGLDALTVLLFQSSQPNLVQGDSDGFEHLVPI